MITNFKIYEKMGIDKNVVELSNIIYDKFKKYYDDSKIKTDNYDYFFVDIPQIIKSQTF